MDYKKLPKLVTIFILTYDPFGENAMYYEAGCVLKTHPQVSYDDGVQRIYLYVGGQLPENAGEEEKNLRTLLRYINDSTESNATDDNTKRLNEIVRSTKARKDIGVKYMKSWERERELLEAGKAEGIELGRTEGGDLRDAQRIEDMLRRGKTAEEIIDFCGYPDELVKKIEAQKHINA